MISCSAFVTAFSNSEKERRWGDIGPDFSFQDIVNLVENTLQPYAAESRTMASNGSCQISFFCASNHDGGLKNDIEGLFEKLANLGSGLFAYCSLIDDEFGPEGGAWEFRVNHPDFDLDGIDIERRDFTKREWS